MSLYGIDPLSAHNFHFGVEDSAKNPHPDPVIFISPQNSNTAVSAVKIIPVEFSYIVQSSQKFTQ